MKQPPSSDSSAFAPADTDLTTKARAVLAHLTSRGRDVLAGKCKTIGPRDAMALLDLDLLDGDTCEPTALGREVARLLANGGA